MLQDLLTPPLLKAAMPQASEHNVLRFVPALVTTMTHYSITGTLRVAHFLAQVAQESGQLAFTEELASGAAYEGRADLGNTEPGDGPRFKGRGLIQLTGRANYAAFGRFVALDLLTDPKRVQSTPRQPPTPAARHHRTPCQQWSTCQLPQVSRKLPLLQQSIAGPQIQGASRDPDKQQPLPSTAGSTGVQRSHGIIGAVPLSRPATAFERVESWPSG